jgi:sigma-B regulation protein RsbU (phosphoserine phosphatase)
LLRSSGATELFTEGSFPVGLIPEATHTSLRVTLEPGDTLVLFSDGVTEAVDLEHQLFGESRLQSVLAGEHDVALDNLRQKIVVAVEKFSGAASQADDITLLLVRYRAAGKSASTVTA